MYHRIQNRKCASYKYNVFSVYVNGIKILLGLSPRLYNQLLIQLNY